MSIASDFRTKMDVALGSADRTRGDSSQDSRRARLQQDLDIAELVLMPKEMLATYTTTIEALQAQAVAKDAEIAELKEDKALFDALRDESWDLRCFSIPTGGDDADIGWRVVGHWMAEPQERVVGEAYTDEPRAAIRSALGQGEDIASALTAVSGPDEGEG